MRSKFILGFCAALALLVSGATEAVVKVRTKSNQSNERCVQSCPIPRNQAATAPSAACDAEQRTYTGGRCLPDKAVVTQVSPASSTKPKPVIGMECKPNAQSKDTPISGIIKGGGCIKITPPIALSKGIKEKGIK